MGAGIPPWLRLFNDCDDEEIPAMGDGSGLAEAALGLDGVRVTGVSEADGEVTIEVETTESRAWCRRCGRHVVPSRRIGYGSMSAIWSVSAVRRGCGSGSAGGAAASRCVRRGRGPNHSSSSMPKSC